MPISRLSVSLHISSDLTDLLNGNKSCYVGAQGSSTPCEIMTSGDSFYVSADNLAPGENVTLAVGFKPQTYAAYTVKPLDQAKILAQLSPSICRRATPALQFQL